MDRYAAAVGTELSAPKARNAPFAAMVRTNGCGNFSGIVVDSQGSVLWVGEWWADMRLALMHAGAMRKQMLAAAAATDHGGFARAS